MLNKAIDVAQWQGKIDWAAVKAAGIGYAIIKCIIKSGAKDPKFDENYTGAKAQGILVDTYTYTYAKSPQEAAIMAQAVAKSCAGKKIGRVWFDFEEDQYRKFDKGLNTAIYKTYKEVLTGAGYGFGVYCGAEFIKLLTLDVNELVWMPRYYGDNTDEVKVSGYPLTKALPSKLPQNQPSWGIAAWQYTSKGRVPGIIGNCDISEIYSPTILAELGSVGASSPTTDPVPPSPPVPSSQPTLRMGDKGNAVRELQTLLNSYGFELKVDGDFGPWTKQAVVLTQKVQFPNEPRAWDGVCGPRTWGVLLKK